MMEYSEIPAARFNGRFSRTSGGSWENRSSGDSTPQASNIWRRSESDFGR